MTKNTRGVLDILWYLFLFVFIQSVCMLLTRIPQVSMSMSLAASGLLTIIVFIACRYTLVSPTYIRTRPWVVLAWALVLAVGSVLPSMWLLELTKVDMPDEMVQMMSKAMQGPIGYAAIGVLAPIAEEMVMRGAVQRRLTELLGADRNHWIAIGITAAIFGLLHGNAAQFVHAFLIGLLLGWMYYRTGSLIPGIIFHWVNNSIAIFASRMYPGTNDVKLIDIFGTQQHVLLAVGFSLCIFLPALYQLAIRMKQADSSRING